MITFAVRLVEMLSFISTVCVLETSNVEVQFLTSHLQASERHSSYRSFRDYYMPPYYAINDTNFSTYAGKERRRTGEKSRGKGGYFRAKSKFRNIHHRDVSHGKYSNEYWIKRTIMTKYDRDTIPASRDVATIPLYVGMSLYHILDTVIMRVF